MPTIPLQNLGIKGLNTDVPPQALSPENFSEGLNMRPSDGSLQGVYKFPDNFDTNVTGATARNIYALAQWTPVGSDSFNLAYLYESSPNVISFQISQDILNPISSSSSVTAVTNLSNAGRFGFDFFPFNGVLIVNDGINQPIRISNNGTEAAPNYQSLFLSNWFSGLADGSAQEAVVANRVTAQRMAAYNNRLIALNLSGEYLNNENLGNASLAWSTPITDINTLNGMTWRFSATNSAGDDILTETPGQLLDASQLGPYLIVYKDDSVYRYQDSGDPLYLVSEMLFEDDGLYSPNCFEDIGDGRHFVLGNYGIYIHDGGPNKQDISKGRIQKDIYNTVNPAHKNRTFTFLNSRDKEVWVCYSAVGNTGTGTNFAYVYNYKEDLWYKRTLPNLKGIEEGELNGQIYTYGFSDQGIYLLSNTFESDGYARFLKQDLGNPHLTKNITAVYPMSSNEFNTTAITANSLNSSTVDAELAKSYATREATYKRTFDPNNNSGYKRDYRLNGRYFNLEVSMNGAVNPKITGLDLEVRPSGKR
ncbi:putative structural protein [Roseobacter phage CRP-7]|nr:putative structural protein [Roseobacter phage CRP-7]